jgi:hypothetical protein
MAQGELAVLLVVHLLLTALPAVAVVLFVASRGEKRVPVLLALGMVATGVVAMVCFWGFYADHEVGLTFTYLVFPGSVLAIGWVLWEGGIDRALARQLATPLALWALGTAFLVFFGFVHGGVHDPFTTATTRFSGLLPVDNYLPLHYSDWFFQHAHQRPPEVPGEWLASDRPPLQTAFTLPQRVFLWDGYGTDYQVLAVALQQLWIVGLWALLVAARIGALTRALAMLTVLVSDLAIVNGFFVWPKMLPAAMLLAAAALVLTPLWSEVRRSLWGAALFAALLALAMLGHGASIFGVLPLLAVAAWRGLPSWRWVGVAVLAGFVLMGPWWAYQHWGDPPGNRLTKWYLGGAVEVDDRGVLEAIEDGYSEIGFGGTLHKKGQNFVAIFGGKPLALNVEQAVESVEGGDWENVVRPIRATFFFNLIPSLGLLLAGPIAMAIRCRRRPRESEAWRLACLCLAAFGIGTLLWALIMYGGATAQTVIHQGSYLLPLLGIVGCVLGLRASYPRFGLWWLGVNAALMLAIYTPDFEPAPGTSYSAATAVLAALSLLGFLAVALWPVLRPPRRADPPAPARRQAPVPART